MSKKDCRNDCATSPRFPRRPGTRLFAGDGETCFCCNPGEQISADNRPALPHFNYRIGAYASIREFLLHEIDHTQNLQGWTHREPDDPAIALLEGAAILGDILTFYQETYANEAFLRTAKWRESVADLVRLLGYRLSPALGGKATFAFEIKKDEPVTIPAGFPVKATLEELDKPAEFETVGEITAYPWLSRFNLFRPLEERVVQPSTMEFYIAEPDNSSPLEIKAGDRLMIGESDAVGASQPKKLTKAEIVIVDSVRQLHGAKIFKIKGKLKRSGNVSQLAAYKLGRAFHHFGYNSPLTVTETNNLFTPPKITTKDVPISRKVNEMFFEDLVTPGLIETDFPLDAEIRDLPNNVPVIIQANFKTPAPVSTNNYGETVVQTVTNQPVARRVSYSASFLPTDNNVSRSAQANVDFLHNSGNTFPTELVLVRTIVNIKNAAMKWGALTGTVSMLSLSESPASSVGGTSEMSIRDVIFHEVVSPLFIIREAKRETTKTRGFALNFYGTAAQAENLKDRRIMLEKAGEEAKILSVINVPTAFDAKSRTFPRLHPIIVSDAVDYGDFPNENPIVTVFGNLADADEGKTQPEIVLGSGDNSQTFQTFKLPKSPLTYHLQTTNTPPETPELEIYVGGRLWQRVDAFFNHGADEQIYIVREDEENNSWVQFGDGQTGARLPNGIKNITAVERVGAGAFGALKADTKAQAGATLKNLDKILMPVAAAGGTERESGENAKNSAPGKVQSLGRLVSVRDFEAEAAAIAGVASASAAWQIGAENIPAMVVTILMETGRSVEIESVRKTLYGYNQSRGAMRFPVEVVAGKRLYVTVSVSYALDATFRADAVEPEIRKALGVNFGKALNREDRTGLFSLAQRRFGEREYASSIEGAVQSVAGVVWARVTSFSALSDADKPDLITLPGVNALNPIVSCAREHILSLYDKHLFLISSGQEGK